MYENKWLENNSLFATKLKIIGVKCDNIKSNNIPPPIMSGAGTFSIKISEMNSMH